MSELVSTMPRYESYKDSGVAWIGEIPSHWEVKRLKHSTTINCDSLPENTPKNFEIEYVDIGSVSYERGIEKTEIFFFRDSPSRARRLAKEGDTIISTVRTYLKAIDYVNFKKEKYVYSTGFAILRPNGCMVPKFLTSFVRSEAFTNQVEDESKGMSYPAINGTDLSRLFILKPKRTEQTAIAAFLDRKTAQIDQAVAIKEKQIALLKERKQILIQNAVTRGLDPDAPMRDSGVAWIGEIPAHWEVKALKYIANLQSGETISSEHFSESGYPVYGGNGFRGYTNDYTNDGNYILIGRQGALCGNVNYASGKFYASEHAVIVHTLCDVETIWLGEAIRASNLNHLSQSAAQPGISVVAWISLFEKGKKNIFAVP